MKRMTWVVETDEMYSREKSWVKAFDLDCNTDEVKYEIRTERRNRYISSKRSIDSVSFYAPQTYSLHRPFFF